MTQNSPQKPSEIAPKTGPESNVVFPTIFNEFWAHQTSKNTKKPTEHLCFLRVSLFRIDHHFDQKTFKNDPRNQSKIDQQIDQENDPKNDAIFIKK